MQPSVSNSTEARHLHHAPDANRGAKIKSLIWHLFQMFIAMAFGHALYQMVFVNLLAPVSYKDYLHAHPLFNYWSMMVAMMLPMIALMRYHKEDWRYCAEMTLAMLVPIVLLTVLVFSRRNFVDDPEGSGHAANDVGHRAPYGLAP